MINIVKDTDDRRRLNFTLPRSVKILMGQLSLLASVISDPCVLFVRVIFKNMINFVIPVQVVNRIAGLRGPFG
jgi:hypothetical protein